jgi:multicomponent Na+:H+ antiporter subunit F
VKWIVAWARYATADMYYVVTFATLITMGLALIRAVLGPTVYDRVLSVNMFGTKTVLLISVIAFLGGRPDFLDLALAYALINFIGVLAVLEFFKSRAARRTLENGRQDSA